ncbi:MAG: Hsp20/alpha crystallin family protein [Promethearchaeota archaeon]
MSGFDDFFKRIKDKFDIDFDIFDFDFIFLPESQKQMKKKFKKAFSMNPMKSFKVSYHYETGMDKPEIKIDGDLNPDEIKNFMNNLFDRFNVKEFNIISDENQKVIDANELSLTPQESNNEPPLIEPAGEIITKGDYLEIILDVPGIKVEDIVLNLLKNGKELEFTAENDDHRYYRLIKLPFKSCLDNVKLNVNNGIATIEIFPKE